MQKLILGTRASKLALAQSRMIAAALQAAHADLEIELREITTQGDRVLDVALSAVGDKGLFVKELEQALFDRSVDFCVHSGKDLPSQVPPGLTLAAFPRRADPRDVLVLPQVDRPAPANPLDWLTEGARVGTSSLRRASQIRALRPDLQLDDVRGNVDTRLRKLASGQYDALLLAAAGLDRLGLVDADDRIVSDGIIFVAGRLPVTVMVPAVAQGTLAIECRADDQVVIDRLAVLDDPDARATALAERALLRRLEGGCQVPIAAYAEHHDGQLALSGLVGSLDGSTILRKQMSGSIDTSEQLGTELAEHLLAAGALAILAEIAGGAR
jgi:hydroxymethylbilane synthase